MKSEAYAIACMSHLLCGGPAPINPPDKRLYLSLHEVDPALTGEQTHGEIVGIGRIAVEWSKAEWANDGIVFFNKNKKTFPKAKLNGGSKIARFWGLGYSPSGKGELKISAKLKEEQEIVSGMVIDFEPGKLTTREF